MGVCLAATHLPLLSFLSRAAVTGELAFAELAVLVLATLAGAGLALFGIAVSLEPVQHDAGARAATERSDTGAPLPATGNDVIRGLLDSVNRAAVAAQDRIRALDIAAKEDMLTGIRNRRGFMADLEALVPGSRGAVALVDLDYFKQVNDRLGHDEGDRVLRSFAARLSLELRRHDIVARWGGEEFAVLFCDATEAEAGAILDRVAARMRNAPLVRIDGRPLSFSAGVARFGGRDLSTTLRCADAALYQAKHGGRARIECASRDVRAPLPLA